MAYGNPLERASILRDFKKTHAKKIAELGRAVRTSQLLSAELIIENSKYIYAVEKDLIIAMYHCTLSFL